jgi:hypothetical protein
VPGNFGLLGLPVVAVVYSLLGDLSYLAGSFACRTWQSRLAPLLVCRSQSHGQTSCLRRAPAPYHLNAEQSWCGHAEAEIGACGNKLAFLLSQL